MGEIAEMMLNGDLDEETGEWIGPGQGFPRSLRRERAMRKVRDQKLRPEKPWRCEACEKRFASANAVADHARALHDVPALSCQEAFDLRYHPRRQP